MKGGGSTQHQGAYEQRQAAVSLPLPLFFFLSNVCGPATMLPMNKETQIVIGELARFN